MLLLLHAGTACSVQRPGSRASSRASSRADWVVSPYGYHREEVEEPGTNKKYKVCLLHRLWLLHVALKCVYVSIFFVLLLILAGALFEAKYFVV